MLSKFIREAAKQIKFKSRSQLKFGEGSKHYSDLVPPNQYDTPLSKKFHLGYVLKEYWETIPLFLTTCTSIGILVIAIAWACKNKVSLYCQYRG
jgi:hypothetical protein